MRKKVLKDEVIALSGIIQLGADKTKSIVYRLCIQFGATVVDDVTDDTTVLIAARPSTEKVRLAMKKRIPVVTPEWLYQCTAKWINAPKSDYKPTGLDPSRFRDRRRQEEHGNRSPKLCDIEAISKADLKTMEEEVDKELEGLTDDSEEDGQGSDTSADEPILAEKKEEKKPENLKKVEEEDGEDERNQRLLEKLKAGEGDSDDDEVLRNGDIESRKRKRAFESAGGTDDEDDHYEPESKRMSVEDKIEDLEEDDDDDDEDDELEAALEHELNG